MTPIGLRVRRSFVALLFALSWTVQQQAEPRMLLANGCVSADTCGPAGPHYLTLGDPIAAQVAASSRVGVTGELLERRTGSHTGMSSGVDVLFHARNGLHTAQARRVQYDELAFGHSLHAAVRNAASAPSRAPPAHS